MRGGTDGEMGTGATPQMKANAKLTNLVRTNAKIMELLFVYLKSRARVIRALGAGMQGVTENLDNIETIAFAISEPWSDG